MNSPLAKRSSWLLLGIFCFGTPSSSDADITQTFTQGPTPTAYSFNFAANQYNSSVVPGGAPLTSVNIDVILTYSVTFYITNNSSTTQTYIIESNQIPFSLSAPVPGPFQGDATTYYYSGITGPPGSYGSISPSNGPGNPLVYATGYDVEDSEDFVVSPSQLPAFMGSGVSDLDFTLNVSNPIVTPYPGFSSNLSYSATVTPSTEVDIIYNYTPFSVPEPSSVVMLAVGLGSAFLAAGRRYGGWRQGKSRLVP